MPDTCKVEQLQKPKIIEDVDRPFEETEVTKDKATLDKLKEKDQDHNHKVEDYKNIVGGILLAVCFLVIIGFSIASLFGIQSTLSSSAFEFTKTIATAVIGYLFGTNIKK